MERQPRQSLPELLYLVAGISLLLLGLAAGPARRLGGDADILERLHVALQMARVEAVARGTVCRVAVDPRAGRVEIREERDGENPLLHALVLPRRTALTWIGARSEPSPGAPFEVAFDPRGLPVDGAGEILFGSAAAPGSVEVFADGELRLTSLADPEHRAGL